VKEYLGNSITIGIGEIVGNVNDLFRSYYQSCNVLEYKVLYGNSQILYINDLRREKRRNYFDLYKTEFSSDEIIKAIVDMDCKKVIHQFEGTVDKLVQIGADFSYIRILFLQYIGIISRIPYELNIELEEDFLEREYEIILNCKTIHEMNEYISKLSLKIIEAYKKECEKDQGNMIANEVKEYILKNYNSIISLDLLADRFFVSKYHLSRIFKQKVGKNFNEFLNHVRIEKAKELLKDTNLNIIEIARGIGYDTPNSFSRMFKNKSGLSPTGFRNLMRKKYS
jgi:two-component system response regulator YesN